MSGCCHNECVLDPLQKQQRRTLRIVLAINTVMFIVIASAAVFANSSALLSDSLDNLGDALTYALSLYAVTKGNVIKAKVALFKGCLIFIAAAVVSIQIIYKLFYPAIPIFELMGIFSLIGLIGNSTCLYLLSRYRNDDVNMNSVWECSRNDIVTNISVFLAAAGVWLMNSGWPDIIVATCLVVFLFRSAMRVISSSRRELLVS